jgi:hypothetical protein
MKPPTFVAVDQLGNPFKFQSWHQKLKSKNQIWWCFEEDSTIDIGRKMKPEATGVKALFESWFSKNTISTSLIFAIDKWMQRSFCRDCIFPSLEQGFALYLQALLSHYPAQDADTCPNQDVYSPKRNNGRWKADAMCIKPVSPQTTIFIFQYWGTLSQRPNSTPLKTSESPSSWAATSMSSLPPNKIFLQEFER